MKNHFQHIVPVLLLALVAGCSSTPSAPIPDGLQESGSFLIRENEVLRIGAGTAGEGTLIFEG